MRKSILLASLILAPTLAAQKYEITHTYNVGGEGGWDYVIPDPPRHRLFIARQNRVAVVDMNTGRLVAEITGINGAHGTALVPDIGRGFATSGNDSSIVMFDATSYKGLLKIKAGEDADAIIYDPQSKHVFSLNGDANTATVVDSRRGTVVANIPLGGKPEYGQSSRDGMVYANLVDSSQVVEIDTKTNTVTRRWSTAPCRTGVDGDRHRPPEIVQWLPQRSHGNLRLQGGQRGGDRSDRRRVSMARAGIRGFATPTLQTPMEL
jgi:DNA-binding beta-propeller fold protein YncE